MKKIFQTWLANFRDEHQAWSRSTDFSGDDDFVSQVLREFIELLNGIFEIRSDRGQFTLLPPITKNLTLLEFTAES